MSMINCNEEIRNRTRERPIFSVVPPPTELPLVTNGFLHSGFVPKPHVSFPFHVLRKNVVLNFVQISS